VDILITAAHVVSYSFDEDIEEWVQYRTKTPALSRPISFRCNSDPLICARTCLLAEQEACGRVALRRQEVCTTGRC
jgi:hypothetical protein